MVSSTVTFSPDSTASPFFVAVNVYPAPWFNFNVYSIGVAEPVTFTFPWILVNVSSLIVQTSGVIDISFKEYPGSAEYTKTTLSKIVAVSPDNNSAPPFSAVIVYPVPDANVIV